MPDPDDVKDVLAVIGLYEDGTEDCNNTILDHETGLDPTTIDEVLEHLWKTDQIEGIRLFGFQWGLTVARESQLGFPA